MNSLRVALPGFNAQTDTDLDHYSLYSDTDNVLIKEFSRGAATIAVNNGSPAYEVVHNLGYIPFHIVYVKDPATGRWKIVPHFQSAFSVPDFAANADTTKLYISNFSSSTQFVWIIFYDNVVGNSNIILTESANVIKVTRPGINVTTAKDPNQFVFHSDLNSLKILKEGNVSITSTGTAAKTISHGSPVNSIETSYIFYCKFPDGTTAFISGGGIASKNVSTQFVTDLVMTPTNFNFTLGSAGVYNIKYYIFEVPLGGTYTWNTPFSGNRMAVSKTGVDVTTDLHPDHLRYDSRFNTLKYNLSGNVSVNCSGNNQDKIVEVTVPNTWGGTRAFVVYVNNIFGGGGGTKYAFVPHVANTITNIREASAYMDQFNLYLKLRIKEGGAFNYTANFYYKIFKNKLNL